MMAASNARSCVLVATIGCLLLGTTGFAQTLSEAAKIIQGFGSGGKLDRTGMEKYLKVAEFKTIDVDESSALDAGEYMAAQLFARLPSCGDEKARETWLEESSKGPVNAERLYAGNPMWKLHIDETVASHWKRASPQDSSLDEAGVASYLKAERERRGIPTAAERLKKLAQGQQTDVTTQQFRDFFTSEWFDAVDVNGSASLTFVEFTRAQKYVSAATEFCALASNGVVMRDDLRDVAKMEDNAPVLRLELARSAQTRQRAVSPLQAVPVGDVLEKFKQQEKDARDDEKLQDLKPKGFVPGAGYLFAGKRRLTDDKEISWNQEKPAAFLRIIKDFTVDDPVQAEPALFTIALQRGKETTFAIDSTIQVDLYRASFRVLRSAFGVDIDRSTGSDGTNTQTYYGTVRLFVPHRSWLESSYISFSPNVEDNRTKETTKLAGDLLWQPGLRFGHFSTNQWLPVGRPVRGYITPRVAVEFGKVTRAPAGTDKPDVTNVRVELIAGLKFGKRVVASYRGLQRKGAGDSHFQEASLRWVFDDQDRFSLKISAGDGRKSTTDDDKRTASVGLGVKF
jgi:hypothetical protein